MQCVHLYHSHDWQLGWTVGLTHPWDFSTCVVGRWLCPLKWCLLDFDDVPWFCFSPGVLATHQQFIWSCHSAIFQKHLITFTSTSQHWLTFIESLGNKLFFTHWILLLKARNCNNYHPFFQMLGEYTVQTVIAKKLQFHMTSEQATFRSLNVQLLCKWVTWVLMFLSVCSNLFSSDY